MNEFERPNRPPHLEIVRDEQELSPDEKINLEYVRQLLEDKDGNPIDSAYFRRSRFKDDDRRWTQAVFQRDQNGYVISCYEDSILEKPVLEISLQPFRDVYPAGQKPKTVDWVVAAGQPGLGLPTEESFNPGDFRYWLEEIWGPLPRKVQRDLGIIQNPRNPER